MSLTVCYLTGRRDPKIDWFFDSLAIQAGPKPDRVIVVDFFHDERPDWLQARASSGPWSVQHVSPKPTVWQGPHRLTKDHWWAMSSARNTGLCLAPDGWLAYVDDLSVLMPGWLQSVWDAMSGNYVVYGAYKKVNKLVVEAGRVVNYEEFSKDSRLPMAPMGQPVSCAGHVLFGCSLAAPVEAYLSVNGWPEDLCDGLGFEDCMMGHAMGNRNQWAFRYDPRMMTLESEEHHGHRHSDMVFRHEDYGQSPNDKSHSVLSIGRASNWFPNSFADGGIRKIRADVLRGEPFPIMQNPRHEWYTKTPLEELK
jgi:hypothetical protein